MEQIKHGVPGGRRLGLEDLDFECSTARANGNLAEEARQLGKMSRTPKSKSTRPKYEYVTKWDTLYLS